MIFCSSTVWGSKAPRGTITAVSARRMLSFSYRAHLDGARARSAGTCTELGGTPNFSPARAPPSPAHTANRGRMNQPTGDASRDNGEGGLCPLQGIAIPTLAYRGLCAGTRVGASSSLTHPSVGGGKRQPFRERGRERRGTFKLARRPARHGPAAPAGPGPAQGRGARGRPGSSQATSSRRRRSPRPGPARRSPLPIGRPRWQRGDGAPRPSPPPRREAPRWVGCRGSLPARGRPRPGEAHTKGGGGRADHLRREEASPAAGPRPARCARAPRWRGGGSREGGGEGGKGASGGRERSGGSGAGRAGAAAAAAAEEAGRARRVLPPAGPRRQLRWHRGAGRGGRAAAMSAALVGYSSSEEEQEQEQEQEGGSRGGGAQGRPGARWVRWGGGGGSGSARPSSSSSSFSPRSGPAAPAAPACPCPPVCPETRTRRRP